MGGRAVWIVIAILIGTTLFGIFKSIDLLRENGRLSHSVLFLTSELEGVKKEIGLVKSDLRESRLMNSQLEDDAADLKGKLAKAESKIALFQQYAVLLKKKYGEVLVKASSLDEANRRMGGQLLRLNLENQEFRMRFSSEKGLKEAIRELKHRKPNVKGRERAPAVKKRFLTLSPPAKVPARPVAIQESGNLGFLVKDGRSTIEQLVDIRVEPASAMADSEKGE